MRGIAATVFVIACIALITLRIFGILGKANPGSLVYTAVPLVISIIVFLIQAKETSKEWYTGIPSLLKLVFLSPLLWSFLLAFMLVKVGLKILEIQNSIGDGPLYGTGNLLTYTMASNLLSAFLYAALLMLYDSREDISVLVNFAGMCAFLLTITAICNIYFYVEITTKPVLP